MSTETEAKCLLVLPFFPGFYNSLLSGGVDDNEKQDAEAYAERECSQQHNPEHYQPEHLRISADEYEALLFDCVDYKATYLSVAKAWLSAFNEWMHEHVGTPEDAFVWESMTSPREYNFGTDRVFAETTPAVMKMLFEKSASEKHETLAKVLRETYTSGPGFISGYSNELQDWLDKPLLEWDHNEISALVEAIVTTNNEFDSRGEFSMKLYYRVFDGSSDTELLADWGKFKQKTLELRAVKAEAFAAPLGYTVANWRVMPEGEQYQPLDHEQALRCSRWQFRRYGDTVPVVQNGVLVRYERVPVTDWLPPEGLASVAEAWIAAAKHASDRP